jgi:hypothetical protein
MLSLEGDRALAERIGLEVRVRLSARLPAPSARLGLRLRSWIKLIGGLDEPRENMRLWGNCYRRKLPRRARPEQRTPAARARAA